MRPATIPLAFDCGALGSADVAVSEDLPITEAVLTVFRGGDASAEPALQRPCPVAANSVAIELTPEETEALGAGRHAYQLDVDGGVRLAVGPLLVSPGVRSAL